MSKKELLFWLLFCIVGLGIVVGIFALIGHLPDTEKTKTVSVKHDKKPVDRDTAQAIVTAETMTYYSNKSVENMKAALDELNDWKPIKPGETK